MARALVLLLAVVAVVAVAYGSVGRRGGDATPTVVATQQAAAQGGQTPAGETPVSQPAETPVTSSAPLTPEQLQQYKPNELGQIPILEYHQIGPNPEQFVRTPDQMRGDLQWLYDHGFYVINISEILADRIDVPLGKKPVVLTFDDSPAGQFRLLRLDTGQYAIDPNCAVGIMETFFAAHPDFGRGGLFVVLPNMVFDWTTVAAEPDQQGLDQMKVQWLVANGYELSNHTRDHVSLGDLTNDQIMYQLAEANIEINKLAPDAPIRVVTLPFGIYPTGGDDTLLRGFDYNGQHFEWEAALLVGANPTVVPLSTEYDPYAMARIQAFDDELNKWFGVFEDNPGILYVSDGNPDTVTIPNDLHSWLVGTFDESKVHGRTVIRY